MKKTMKKKLVLGTETLRSLQERTLRGVAAGYGSTMCTNPTLWSDCCKQDTYLCTPGCEW